METALTKARAYLETASQKAIRMREAQLFAIKTKLATLSRTVDTGIKQYLSDRHGRPIATPACIQLQQKLEHNVFGFWRAITVQRRELAEICEFNRELSLVSRSCTPQDDADGGLGLIGASSLHRCLEERRPYPAYSRFQGGGEEAQPP